MRVKLSRHGNSLGFVVPAAIVREAGLEAGLEYELALENGGALSLRPASALVWKPDMSLGAFLDGLPDGPLEYEDVPAYTPSGKELDW